MSKVMLSLKRNKIRYSIIVVVLLFVSITITVLMNQVPKTYRLLMDSTNYSYESHESNNGVVLHVMRTEPQHIELTTINNNVLASRNAGINGGFFWENSLLSMALDNNIPVNGEPKKYGSGWFNEKYARGTLVFDRTANKLDIQVVSRADELKVTDRSQYWAQGGISMSLRDQDNWKQQALKEAIPFPDDLRLRSGMVYDKQMNIYLVVTAMKCTAEEFRETIMEMSVTYSLVDGIFLDGDGSSQMSAREVSLIGDGRKVVQMIKVN